MATNKTLIEKADWAVGDLSAGGALNAEQSDRFIRTLLNQPTIIRDSRQVVMSAPQRNINKIQLADRILMPATSGTALDADTSPTNRRSKPTTDQVQLSTKEVIAEIRLPYDVIEDNVERGNIGQRNDSSTGGSTGGIKDTIMDLIAERAALDLEELALLGDTISGDAYLALNDGFLKLANAGGQVVDAAGAPISKTVFRNGMQAMPDAYLRNRSAMRHYVSVDQEIAYRDTLATRETGMGDSLVEGTRDTFGFGVPVRPVALMPNAQGLLVDPSNLIFGIQRQIHIETDKDITSRQYIIVLTARVDFKIEEATAAVNYTNLG